MVYLSEVRSKFNFLITINYKYTFQGTFNQNRGRFNSNMMGNNFGCKDRRIFYINGNDCYVSENPIFLKWPKFGRNFL